MITYEEFLLQKEPAVAAEGLREIPDLCPSMKGHQRALTEFALRQGRSAGFIDTGLGKSLIELEWCRVMGGHTNKPTLLLTPLAVAAQMKREADRFGIPAQVVREPSEVQMGVNITNYDRVERFSPQAFGAVALDESSILKGCTSKTLWKLIEMFSATPYRYAATATPAPNDHTELGNHANFLGVMSMQEMLMRWFLHDSARTQEWRLKRHAVQPFWNWVSSWARCLMMPSDIGFSDEGYTLPELKLIQHTVVVDGSIDRGSFLFRMPATSATEIHQEKRRTVGLRAEKTAELVASEANEPWIIWCNADYEADELRKAIPEAVEVRGSMKLEEKEARLIAFSEGRERILITKPSIAGFGLNWQHCARQCFVGLSYSYEQFYQAVRRSWRFGQTREVHAHCILADTEAVIWQSISEKRRLHDGMKHRMTEAMGRDQREGAKTRHSLNLGRTGRLPEFL